MEVTSSITAEDNHFVTTFGPVKLNSSEKEQLVSLGALLLAVGGSFDEDGIEFTLPTRSLRVPSDLPIHVKFSIAELTGPVAAAQASLYKETLLARLQIALTAWMSFDASDYEETTVTTITA